MNAICEMSQLKPNMRYTKSLTPSPTVATRIALHASALTITFNGSITAASLLLLWRLCGCRLKEVHGASGLFHFLKQSWGLQVSFCTSVARRVSLRELVADLLPIFTNPLKQDEWQELLNKHQIIHAFMHEDLFAWLRTLSPSLQDYILTLVRTILEQLQHTGLDRQKTSLIIAWPQEGDTQRGLRIPCKAQTCWAHIIADAEDCATFAYMTPKCLETNHLKCQGSPSTWKNVSKMLVTEMSPSQSHGQTITPTVQWALEDKGSSCRPYRQGTDAPRRSICR